jgi:hypothetical protein
MFTCTVAQVGEFWGIRFASSDEDPDIYDTLEEAIAVLTSTGWEPGEYIVISE